MKYLEIAKSCGAINEPSVKPDVTLILIDSDQLHAYTEQVCKQMVEALKCIDEDLVNPVHYILVKEALAAHREMMGDLYE